LPRSSLFYDKEYQISDKQFQASAVPLEPYPLPFRQTISESCINYLDRGVESQVIAAFRIKLDRSKIFKAGSC
jgi:hypothetical protein